ncbi:MAG TPA: 50S ribosomal protein L9, partial [Geobacteraceae bacterium]|nr:50S ribosomal protein L9 [Geobacteraceae bacterium]
MKVILKENMDNLGHIGDIVKVAPGYARNYLLPRGLALEATERNAKALEHAKRQMEYKKNKVLEVAKQFAAKIEGISLVLAHQAGEEG